MGSEDPQRKFVVFLDSLGPDDVEGTPWLSGNAYDGDMDAGVPFVTPKVLGEIYTGENPAKHGLPAVSRFEQQPRTRPALPTLPEIVAADDTHERVCNFGLPFIVPPDVDAQGDYWHGSQAMQQQSFFPDGAQPHLTISGPAGDLSHPEEDGDLLFNLRVDYTRQFFGAARSLAEAQDFDVMFLSYRLLDSYCHYNYNRTPEDSDVTDRDELLQQVVDAELQDLANHGDVFVFGDHGARELTDVFRINRWLMEQGYLDADVDVAFKQKAEERGLVDDSEDTQGQVIHAGSPFVDVDEQASTAICADPFSTGLTTLEGATESSVDAMIEDLTATDAIEDVHVSAEKWTGPHLAEAPDLYPERAPGVFVSGNMAPEKGGPELTRSGVHDPIGAFGATTDLDVPDEPIEPTDLFDLILDFLDVDASGVTAGGAIPGRGPEQDERDVQEHLEAMGYI